MSEPALPELRDRLVAMVRRDREVRDELAATGELFEGYAQRMAVVHREHGAALAVVLESHGWPGVSLVGEEGAEAAWLLLQHAIGDPPLQRRGLHLLRETVARGDAPAWQAAYLEDRIAFNERRPQRYGTQFDWDADGRMSPWTLDDPAGVDDRRRALGLPPLAEQTARMRAESGERGEGPPGDWAVRQREIAAWARSVGWLPAS